MDSETAEQIVREKHWVADDIDEISTNDNYIEEIPIVRWTGPYIAYTQIQNAIADDDVQVCDIEADGDEPIVNIEVLTDEE